MNGLCNLNAGCQAHYDSPSAVSSAERKRFFGPSQSVIDAAAALNHEEAMAAASSAHCEYKGKGEGLMAMLAGVQARFLM